GQIKGDIAPTRPMMHRFAAAEGEAALAGPADRLELPARTPCRQLVVERLPSHEQVQRDPLRYDAELGAERALLRGEVAVVLVRIAGDKERRLDRRLGHARQQRVI